MTTTTLPAPAGTLDRDLTARVLTWLTTHPGQHDETEWALRTYQAAHPRPVDTADHTTHDVLSLAAVVCTVAGYDLGWGPVGPHEQDEAWPVYADEAASKAYDPSAGEWVHVAVAARHLLGLDSDAAADLFEAPDDTGAVVAALTRLLTDTEN